MIHRSIWRLIVAGACLALAACAGPGANAQPDAAPHVPQTLRADHAPGNRCDAEAARFLIGHPANAATLQRALTAARADEVRTLGEDSIVTREYKEGRLNAVVDGSGKILGFRCG